MYQLPDGRLLLEPDEFDYFGEKLTEFAAAMEACDMEALERLISYLGDVWRVAGHITNRRHWDMVFKPADKLHSLFLVSHSAWRYVIVLAEHAPVAKQLAEVWPQVRAA